MTGTALLKVSPKMTDMAAATPAVLARRRCEDTSPTNAQPSCPTFAGQYISNRILACVVLERLTSVVPERPEAGDKDVKILKRLRESSLAEDADE